MAKTPKKTPSKVTPKTPNTATKKTPVNRKNNNNNNNNNNTPKNARANTTPTPNKQSATKKRKLDELISNTADVDQKEQINSSKVEQEQHTNNGNSNSDTITNNDNNKQNMKWTRTFMHMLDINAYYQPYAIRRMAFNSDETLLAVARINSEIEIWKTPKSRAGLKNENDRNIMDNKWTVVKRIPAKKNTSVEALVWMKAKKVNAPDRLFTAGMHGYITEWDLATLLPKNTSGVYGGAIWSLAVHGQTIAAACEDGNVRLYNSDLLMKQSFGPSKSETVPKTAKLSHCEGHRLLALCFNADGSHIYCGGLTGVYCFELKTGDLKFKIALPSSICMSLCYLKDNTLIVGDSAGQTMFCDGAYGTTLSLHKQHLADVLQIIPSQDESKVFVAGVDPKISMFQKGSKANQWVHTHGKYPHNHDVYALALFDDCYVMSGGIDGRLSFTDITDYFKREETKSNFYGFVPLSDVAHARSIQLEKDTQKRLLYVSDNRNVISIIQLPEKPTTRSEEPAAKRQKFDIDSAMNYDISQNLLSQLLTVSKGGWIVSSFAVSPDGKSVCCCGADFAIIFKLAFSIDEDGNVEVSVTDKFDMKNMNVVPGLHCTFLDNETVAVTSRTNDTLQLFNTALKQLVYNYDMKQLDDKSNVVSTQSVYFPNSVHSLCANERYIVVARGHSVLVYDTKATDNHLPYWTISRVSNTDSIVYKTGFLSPNEKGSPSFYILSSHNNAVIYDIANKNISQNLAIGRSAEDMRGGVRQIVEGQSTLHGQTNYALFNLTNTDRDGKKRPLLDEFMILSVLRLDKDEYVQLRFDYRQFYLSLLGVTYRKRFAT